MGDLGNELSGKPAVEGEENGGSYSHQIVRLRPRGTGSFLEKKSRDDVVKKHLRSIDPRLERWSEKFGPREGQIKDISHPEYFSSEYSEEKSEELDTKDLVLVHVTDTFPENGIIKPTRHFRPEILRNTIHFTLNGPVIEEVQYGAGKWPRKKYAIMIPFDVVKDRTENFSTEDTLILGELELPQGSMILASSLFHLPKDQLKSGKAETALENFGNTPADFKRAIYRAILSEGYCPMEQGSFGWINWEESPGPQVLRDFVQKNGLTKGVTRHVNHWSALFEDASLSLLSAKRTGDPERMATAIEDAEELIKKRTEVPQQYRDQLSDLIEKYKSD